MIIKNNKVFTGFIKKHLSKKESLVEILFLISVFIALKYFFDKYLLSAKLIFE